jgi:hypothetical protein
MKRNDLLSLEITRFDTTLEETLGRGGVISNQDKITCTSNCQGCGTTYECVCGGTLATCPATWHISCGGGPTEA